MGKRGIGTPRIFFLGGGVWRADPEAIYNLCLIFKIMKICYENNMKISELSSSQATGKIKTNRKSKKIYIFLGFYGVFQNCFFYIVYC